ncbi:MAG: hypothetical protein KY476_18730 [Planctomycetes bacterium]|nr:hypothetical protein [Planctomycetota bacterium]
MKFRIADIAVLFVALAATRSTATDLDFARSMSPEALRAEAELVLTGRVRTVYVNHRQSEGGIDGLFVADVEIGEVEKGELEGRIAVPVRYWARLKTVRKVQGCSPTSYRPLPHEGDLVRVYLRRTPYGWRVMPPNGFEILEHNSDPNPVVVLTDAASPGEFGAAATSEAALQPADENPAPGRWWMPAAALALGALMGVPLGRITKRTEPLGQS